MSILKRIRTILKTGLTWVAFWVPLCLVLTVSQVLTGYHEAWSLSYLLRLAVGYGVTGFLTGSAFAAVMSLTESRKSFTQLKSWRVALWGGVGAFMLPAAMWLLGPPNPWRFAHVGLFLVNAAVVTVAGAGSALSMLGLARRADRLPPPPDSPALTRGPSTDGPEAVSRPQIAKA